MNGKSFQLNVLRGSFLCCIALCVVFDSVCVWGGGGGGGGGGRGEGTCFTFIGLWLCY
jgi:hypothetical protein